MRLLVHRQDLSHGLYPCPSPLINIPGNTTHCCFSPLVAATQSCPNAVRNPQSPFDLWRAQTAAACPLSYVPQPLNISVYIACRTDANRDLPGSYACVPVLDEASLASLGYDVSTITQWNGSVAIHGNMTRIKQMFPVNGTVTAARGNPVYPLFGVDTFSSDLPPSPNFYDGYTRNFTLYNYTYDRFYGYNVTMTTADGSGVDTTDNAWDRHDSFNNFFSDVIAQDIVTYETIMTTFYGSNPITW